jgi:hypothetical protein
MEPPVTTLATLQQALVSLTQSMTTQMTQQQQALASLAQLMATQHQATLARFDGVDKRLDAVESRLGAVESRLDAVESRLDAVESRLDAVESRLGAVESRLGAVESRLGAVESRLGAVEGRLDVLESAHGNDRVRLNNSLKASTAPLQPLPFDRDGNKWPGAVEQPPTMLDLAVAANEAKPGMAEKPAWNKARSKAFLKAAVAGYDAEGSDGEGEVGDKARTVRIMVIQAMGGSVPEVFSTLYKLA